MEKIRDLLNKVKHPEIDNSLVELGMIGEIQKREKMLLLSWISNSSYKENFGFLF